MKGTINLSDGSTYTGDLKNGIPEGKGILVLPNRKTYTGDFKLGKPEGKGEVVYVNGKIYTGDFKNGIPEGKGIMILPNRKTYTGDFKLGKPEGKGKIVYVNGKIYTGSLKNGIPEGKGKMILPDKRTYEGDFKKGKAQGKRTEIFTNLNILKNNNEVKNRLFNDTLSQGSIQNSDLDMGNFTPENIFDDPIIQDNNTLPESLESNKKLEAIGLKVNCSNSGIGKQLQRMTSVEGRRRSSKRKLKRPSYLEDREGYKFPGDNKRMKI